ncbi:hypothetical protein QVD17_23292 [Tagetes erecta]|uniref:Uncharacterized protein n=1 Tax=Tagetes erecta TaxID=13708 RepID=A0AAD8NUG0_TARER|nr:hypothetical protein QVD17_23292 [Tagetes erecta]
MRKCKQQHISNEIETQSVSNQNRAYIRHKIKWYESYKRSLAVGFVYSVIPIHSNDAFASSSQGFEIWMRL